MEILKTYPQLNKPDRRQQNLPVGIERRCGIDRRQLSRLENDVFEAFRNPVYKKKENDLIFKSFILNTFPLSRRLFNIEKSNNDNNTFKTAGIGTLALLNSKEDIRDLMTIAGKSKSTAEKGYYSKFSFFTGTLLEDWMKKHEWGRFILKKVDKSIGEIWLGKKILKVFNTKYKPKNFNKKIKFPFGKTETLEREYVKFSGAYIGRVIGGMLHKIPVLTLGVGFLLETPTILKVKKEDKLKQTANSAINVAVSISTGALFSSVLAPVHPALAVMGLGLGYYLGSIAAKKINN